MYRGKLFEGKVKDGVVKVGDETFIPTVKVVENGVYLILRYHEVGSDIVRAIGTYLKLDDPEWHEWKIGERCDGGGKA